jgi:hypothetical protein
MASVKYAMVCDGCGERGPEYEGGWAPRCKDCDKELCQECGNKTGHVLRETCCEKHPGFWFELDGEYAAGE